MKLFNKFTEPERNLENACQSLEKKYSLEALRSFSINALERELKSPGSQKSYDV